MSIADIFKDWKAIETHPAGTVLFSEEDKADHLFVILSGQVEISLHGQKLNIEEVGGVIGEMAVIQSESDNPKAKALSEVRLARLDRDQFNQFIAGNTEFSLHAMSVLANRLRATNAFIGAQLKPGSSS
jgi:CRP-like cAMP-binding protein